MNLAWRGWAGGEIFIKAEVLLLSGHVYCSFLYDQVITLSVDLTRRRGAGGEMGQVCVCLMWGRVGGCGCESAL